MERAGFWHRAAATALDAFLAGFVAFAGGAATLVVLEMAHASDALQEYAAGIVFWVLVVIYTTTEVWLARTPGKLAFGLLIGTAAGGSARRWTLALRWSTKYFGLCIVLMNVITPHVLFEYFGGFMNNVVMVGCLQASDEHKRTWHDEWAGTAVLRRPRLMSPPLPAQSHGVPHAR